MPTAPKDLLYELTRMVRDERITSRELRTALEKLEALRQDPAVRADVGPVIEATREALRRRAR